jgi:transcriptional regulator with XRE-family HTH domain
MAKRGRPKTQPMNPLTASRITEARERKGLSKMKLSKEMSCDASAIRKWENGTNNITDDNLEKIASICEVPVAWLKGEAIPDIIQNSYMILNSLNPESAEDHAKEVSEQAEAETLTIIYALKMCGYSVSDIKDKSKFSTYMSETIKNIVETYMNNLN